MGKTVTKQQVADALHVTKGAVYLAARRLNVSHTTLYNRLRQSPDLRAIKDYYDGEMVDIAELQLRESVEGGDPWAVKYVLSTKGKDRGYTERTEITGADGAAVSVTMTWGDEAGA